MRSGIQPRQLLQAGVLIALISLPVFLFIITTQTTPQLNLLDSAWYLNRARLIWQGVLPDLFVYTLAYPTFVGLLDQLLHDALLSGMVANGLILWLILLGAYILGRWLYHSKRIAWLAVALIATNASIFSTLQLFWASAPFTAVVVWCLISCLLVIRHPGIGTAIGLGAVLALAVYTRFEGVVYTLFVPISAWSIYRQRRDARLAVFAFVAAGFTFAMLMIPFALNFLQVRQVMDSELSANVSGIITLLNRTPIEWNVIWRRVTDLLSGFFLHWPSAAWLVGIAGVIWASPRHRSAQGLMTALIIFNLAYTFGLAIWPYPVHIVYYIPFFALILAATLDELNRRGRQWKLLVLPLSALIVMPGLLAFANATRQPVLAYRTSETAQMGEALDSWLEEHGLEQTRIYTFCYDITSFSRANFQMLYRLQWATGWDTPERLLTRMRDESAIMMDCGDFIPFADWRALFEAGIPPGLHEIGRFDKYVFFRPDSVQ